MDIESIIEWLRGLPPAGIYVAIWVTTYIENVFPPSPSDVVLLFIATLIGFGTIGHLPAIAIATLGSVMGFLTAFLIGRRLGRRMVESEKIPFITVRSLKKVDRWFDKYGYWVIVANRFLAGTRAVVSFFAGMTKLDLLRTTILSAISALAWNILVIELGAFLGSNWRQGQHILKQYGMVVTIVLAALIVYMVVRWLVRRKKSNVEGRKTKTGAE
jgi:membrane protein DedA with SNARE-associated domain